jgi:hypothetical protein
MCYTPSQGAHSGAFIFIFPQILYTKYQLLDTKYQNVAAHS